MPLEPIDWMSRAQALRAELVARRRDLHQHPELAFEEVRTAGIVANELAALGLEVITGVGKTGVIGILDGAHDGPTVMLRADMDALPVTEANATDYISRTPGKMHACGHDGHTSIGLAVAKLFAEQREHIAGRIKFIFQPAEELALGAQAMIADHVLSDPKPDIVLGLHLRSDFPLGTVGLAAGPIMAGADDWKIAIRGAGGHGALPEQTHDPIVAGAYLVTALQTIVSRNVSAFDSAVVSVTTFHGGETFNVIPPQVVLTGTFRTYRPEIHDRVERRMRELATGIAASFGCEAEFTNTQLTPPVYNDPGVVARLRKAFDRANMPRPLEWPEDTRWMAAEDMAFYLQAVPGVYLFVGSADRTRHLDYPHHHPRFDIDEDVLPLGAGLLATAIAAYLIPE